MLKLCYRVVFKFKSSKKSNNGTDVNAGQIPQVLYRLPSHDSTGVSRKTDHAEPAIILSRDFSFSVTPVSYKLFSPFSLCSLKVFFFAKPYTCPGDVRLSMSWGCKV